MFLKLIFLFVLQTIVKPSEGTIVRENPFVIPFSNAVRVNVILKSEESWAVPSETAQINCDYKLTPDSDHPVTITWKVGDGPRFATDVLKCSGYTKSSQKCSSLEVADDFYSQRVNIAQDSPSLEIESVTVADNRNFWCQVSLDQIINPEFETDMKSVVLRVYGGGEMPKFHSVKIDDDFSASTGSSATLGCECNNDYHCDDLAWFKGPTDPSSTSYELVYTRTTHYKPSPTEYKAYGDWVGRATLQGDSLVITGLEASDAGKYWCELRASNFYSIGEWATDAKSLVLDIIPASNYFQCPLVDGNYADYKNNHMYFECIRGKTYHRACPTGTIFYASGNVSTCKIPSFVGSARRN